MPCIFRYNERQIADEDSIQLKKPQRAGDGGSPEPNSMEKRTSKMQPEAPFSLKKARVWQAGKARYSSQAAP